MVANLYVKIMAPVLEYMPLYFGIHNLWAHNVDSFPIPVLEQYLAKNIEITKTKIILFLCLYYIIFHLEL